MTLYVTLQILQDLPEDLQRSVLTHTTAPCVQLFAILPEEYHSTALNAKYASIVHDNAICVSARDVLLEGQWDAFWNLVSAQPFLKRVEIKMFQSPRQLIAPLNGMRAVTHLTINKVEWSRLSDGRGGVWPLGNLTSLEHLDLAKNEIDGDHANALARQLRMLTSLQHLNLHKNSLGSKGVQRLSRCFSHLPLLRHLDLGRNNIGTEGIEELVLPLADVTQLTFLSFYDKYTSDSEDHFSAIVLSKMQNLQHMRVLGSVWPKRYIFPHLCVFSSLQHLDIFGNETVSSTSWESANESEAEKFSAVIARELTHLTHLTHLALKFAMVEADVETLGPCLRKMPKLSSIDISGSELGDQEFTAMLRHISEVGSLRRLLLADVNVGEPGVLALEKYLQVAPESLQELSFWAVDDLSREGLRALTSGLQRIRCLQKLDLYNMTWDNDFTGIIADALPALSALKELNLSSCGLYDVDILILAPSISRLTFLQELTVGRNSFGEAGVDLLASNLSNLSRLRCLSLRETSLGSTGGRSLKTYLCDLPVLQLLDLKRSDIQEEGVDALIQLLQLNTALECLYMPSIIANVRRSMFARVNYGLRRVHGWGRHGVGRLARWTFFPNILLRMDSLPPLSDTGSENLRIPAQLINRDRSNEQFNCRALWISVSDSFYSLVQSILTRG